MSEAQLQSRDYAHRWGSGYVTRHGNLVLSWGDPAQIFDLKSTSKSIGVTVLGLALKDGKVRLDDKAKQHHPAFGVPPESNAQTGWLDAITLRHLANQTAGFEKPGGYTNLLFAPGTQWHYSDGGPNWLAECLTLAYGRDLNDVMFERVFTPLGIKAGDIRWRRHSYRPDLIGGIKRREFGSGFSANVNAMARIGSYLREGNGGNNRSPGGFVQLARQPAKELVGCRSMTAPTADHYFFGGTTAVARFPECLATPSGRAYSLIVVIPSPMSRSGPAVVDPRHDGALRRAEAVFDPSLRRSGIQHRSSKRAGVHRCDRLHRLAPYPPSSFVKGLVWAPGNDVARPKAVTLPITCG